MSSADLDEADRTLLEAAREVLRRNYHPDRHQVGAAVRGASGRVYAAVNVEAVGYGPCAEPIALGMAVSAGEREFAAIVAVGKEGEEFPVISPCGNCRQLLVDYAPECLVLYADGGDVGKARAKDLLPGAYRSGF